MNSKKWAFLSLLIFVFCFCISCTSQKKIDPSGKIDFSLLTLDGAGDFSEGLAPAQQDGLWGYINHEGDWVIPLQFSKANSFSEGLALVEKNSKSVYIDRQNKTIITLNSNYWGSDFHDGVAHYVDYDKDRHISINKNGQELQVLEGLDFFRNFSEGFAIVLTGGDYIIIKKDGHILPSKFFKAELFSEGLAAVCMDVLKCGFIDGNGKSVIGFQYWDTKSFAMGLAPVQTDKGWGFIDKKGTMVISPQFGDVEPFSSGLAAVKDNQRCSFEISDSWLPCWGFINEKGEQVIRSHFVLVDSFHGERAIVRQNGSGKKPFHYGAIDKSGNEVVPIIFDFAGDYSEGFSMVRKEIDGQDKYGFVDENGAILKISSKR